MSIANRTLLEQSYSVNVNSNSLLVNHVYRNDVGSSINHLLQNALSLALHSQKKQYLLVLLSLALKRRLVLSQI